MCKRSMLFGLKYQFVLRARSLCIVISSKKLCSIVSIWVFLDRGSNRTSVKIRLLSTSWAYLILTSVLQIDRDISNWFVNEIAAIKLSYSFHCLILKNFLITGCLEELLYDFTLSWQNDWRQTSTERCGIIPLSFPLWALFPLFLVWDSPWLIHICFP